MLHFLFQLANRKVLSTIGLTVLVTQLGGGMTIPARSAIAQPPEVAKSANTKPSTTSQSLTKASFNPPKEPRRIRGGRTTTGTRGDRCVGDGIPSEAENLTTAFTVLGPESTVGLSGSPRPTFVWHLPDVESTLEPAEEIPSYPVTFRLLALNLQDVPELIYEETLPYTAGYNSHVLPDQVESLSSAQRYRWQVIVECDANYPSRSLAQELSLDVVDIPEEAIAAIEGAEDAAARGQAFGQAGLWYDAIAQVANATTPREKAVRQSLLQDLAILEADNIDLAEDLRAIASSQSK